MPYYASIFLSLLCGGFTGCTLLFDSDENASDTDASAIDSGAGLDASSENSLWQQSAYVKSSLNHSGQRFGSSIAISADGNTLAIGAPLDDSNGIGINPPEEDSAGSLNSGAVDIYVWSDNQWVSQARIKASNAQAEDRFGHSIALSDNGDTLVVGAPFEDSGARGFDGDPEDSSAQDSGAAYVFERGKSSTIWSQNSYIKAENTGASDRFGYQVAISGDRNTFCVSATREDNKNADLSTLPSDDTATDSGAVYVYARGTVNSWRFQDYLKSSTRGNQDRFGSAIDLSEDGSTLVVGAPFEDSDATGIDGDQDNNKSINSGAVYVFERIINGVWGVNHFIKASNTRPEDRFGTSISLGSSGETLALGAPSFTATSAENPVAGAVYLFEDGNQGWRQANTWVAPNSAPGDTFGVALDLDENAGQLVVGATRDSISSQGVNGQHGPQSLVNSGAAYVFSFDDNDMTYSDYFKASNSDEGDQFGSSVVISGNGQRVVIGAVFEDSNASGVNQSQEDSGSSTHSGASYIFTKE